jgi:class 3 adenylate cyclase
MGVLREYHACMGRLIVEYQGTVERFAGDSIMIFFNDPVPVSNPAEQAVRMALDMQAEFARLARNWSKRGYSLDMGIGVAQGYATLGTIGFEGRLDYGAIGVVCSLAARLCALALKGFHRPVPAFNATALKARLENPR